jgi:hypothetical protein
MLCIGTPKTLQLYALEDDVVTTNTGGIRVRLSAVTARRSMAFSARLPGFVVKHLGVDAHAGVGSPSSGSRN